MSTAKQFEITTKWFTTISKGFVLLQRSYSEVVQVGYVILGDVLILFGLFFGIFGGGSALANFVIESDVQVSLPVTTGMVGLLFFTGLLIQFASLKKNMFFPFVAFVLSMIQLGLYCYEVLKDGFNWWLSPVQELLNSPETIGKIGNYVGIIVLMALILLPAAILPLMKKNSK